MLSTKERRIKYPHRQTSRYLIIVLYRVVAFKRLPETTRIFVFPFLWLNPDRMSQDNWFQSRPSAKFSCPHFDGRRWTPELRPKQVIFPVFQRDCLRRVSDRKLDINDWSMFKDVKCYLTCCWTLAGLVGFFSRSWGSFFARTNVFEILFCSVICT